jgi:hypothetical protein
MTKIIIGLIMLTIGWTILHKTFKLKAFSKEFFLTYIAYLLIWTAGRLM